METALVDLARHKARLLLAAGRRQRWRVDDVVRSRLYRRTPAFASRVREPLQGTRVAQPEPAPAVAQRTGVAPASVELLLNGPADGTVALAATARYYGLGLEVASTRGAGLRPDGLDAGGGPLLGCSLEGLSSLPETWTALVRQRLAQGATILVNGVVAAEPLRSLLQDLAVDAGVSDRPARVATVTFAADRPDFCGELAGLALQTSIEAPVLSVGGHGAILAYANGASEAHPVIIEVPTAAGRVVISVGTQRLKSDLARAFEPDQVLSVLPAMMLTRQVYGLRAWHSPMALADLVIDDPALNNGRLGMDYRRALAATEAADFHLTVATVPGELALADPDVVQLLAQRAERLSACYHGNDHTGYEFYRTSSGSRRFRGRPLPAQRLAIQQAADRGREFARRTGLGLDRVMVFPHGLGPGDLLPSLGEAGFLASCNWLDRYPLEASRPDQYDLGMRPADVAWGGFPLLWRRRPVDTAGFALDLFLGRPAIAFGHRKNLGAEFGWTRDLAARVNQLSVARPVRWRGLEEVARHAYQQRLDGATWRVLMTANEICLHNPDSEPRVYSVCRPQFSEGAMLASGPADAASPDELVITVTPGGRRVVRQVIPGGLDLPGPRGGAAGCAIPD